MRDGHLGVAAEQRRHAGRGDRGGLRHRESAGPHETQRRRVVEDARERGRGELADAVTGDDAGREVVAERGGGEQAGGDEEGCATAVSRISSASAFVP